MKHVQSFFGAALSIVVAATSCKKDDAIVTPPPAPVVSKVTTATGDITAKVAEFRTLLGNPLNGILPPADSGRREINWDAVPAAFSNNDTFPVNFFNKNSPRGLVMQSSNNAFRVSSLNFSDVNAVFSGQVKTFSPVRTFAPSGTNISTVLFKIPGKDDAAFVHGFGVVFSDVDVANSTKMEFYEGDKSLGIFAAPVKTDAAGLSFLGVQFPDNKVTSVKIICGAAAVTAAAKDISDGGATDLVVMDDFLYSEPKALK